MMYFLAKSGDQPPAAAGVSGTAGPGGVATKQKKVGTLMYEATSLFTFCHKHSHLLSLAPGNDLPIGNLLDFVLGLVDLLQLDHLVQAAGRGVAT